MSFSVDEVLGWLAPLGAELVNADALGECSSTIRIQSPQELGKARSQEIAFFFSEKYQSQMLETQAGIVVTGHAFVEPLRAANIPQWKKTAIIACSNPYQAMAIVSAPLAEKKSTLSHTERQLDFESEPIVHPSAVVDESVQLGRGVRIGAGCVLERDVKIGDGTVLYPQCYIGPGAEVGRAGVLFSRVSLYEGVTIGDRVRLHSGVVIGSDGFGYAPVVEDGVPSDHQKIHHMGGVVIGDDVEIGANSTIDRGTMGDTLIEDRVKIDNLVQIGHNARLRRGAVLCGNSGVAGSTEIGEFSYLGGGCGVTNGLTLGKNVQVAAFALVARNLPDGSIVAGNPMRSDREHFKAHAYLNKMIKKGIRKK